MKYIFLIFLISPSFIFAQAEELPDPEANFLAVIVEQIDSSINWYSGVLGFELINRAANEERGFRQANLQRGAIMLELLELEIATSPSMLLQGQEEKRMVSGFFKFGIAVPEFDSWLGHLEAMGVNFRGDIVEDPVTFKRMIILLDPDGNRIQLFEK